jgi:NTE family protein
MLLALGLLLSGQLQAVTPCVGLVLGGGGARGAAHIGVLKVLERERVPICRIAGTSMGAIVGALYAAGYSPDEIESVLASVDWKDVLNDDPPRLDFPIRRKNDTLRYLLDFRLGIRDGKIQLPRGVIQGQKLLLLLRRLTLHTWHVDHFDDLPIPFRAVATDIARGEPVVFDRGDLALAIRASMSVPAAFAPLRVDGRLLVDGGIVNNVPVDIVRQMGANHLIVVDVGAPLLSDDDLNSPIAITMQMLDVLMKQRTADVLRGMALTDVKIQPELGDIGSADFDRAVETIAPGEAAAERVVSQIMRFSIPAAEYADWQQRHRKRAMDPPMIAFLDVLKHRSRTSGYVMRRLDELPGQPLEVDRVERAIGGAYGLGNYERIAWKPIERNGEVGIQVTPVDKGWGPNFITFGLQISDDFEGRNDYQLGAEYTMTGLNRYGGEWRSRLEVGRVAGLRSEFFQPIGERGQFFVFPYIEYRAFDQALSLDGSLLSLFRVDRGGIGIDAGYEPSVNWRLYGGIFRGHGAAKTAIGSGEFRQRLSNNIGGLRLGLIRDTIDQADFPGAGSRGEIALFTEVPGLGSDGNGEVFDAQWDKALSRGRNRYLLGARLHMSFDSPNQFDALGALGGFTNLSGFTERELLAANSALFRAVYYRQLGGDGLFSVPAYLGFSAEAGNVYDDRDDLTSLDNLIYAGSIFVGVASPFGPVFLGYGRADTGDSSFYLNFGTLLRPRQ